MQSLKDDVASYGLGKVWGEVAWKGIGSLQDQASLFLLSLRHRIKTCSAHMFQAIEIKKFTQALIE